MSTQALQPIGLIQQEEQPLTAFLEALWPDLGGHHLLLWRLPSRRSEWFQELTSDTIAKIAQWAETEDVYAGCGLRHTNLGPTRRGERIEVAAIPGLWIDADYSGPSGKHKKPNLPPTEADAMALIAEMGPPPSAIVHSGHGLQAWWLFREPWVFEEDADRDKAEHLTKAWCDTFRAKARAHGWDADQVGDLPRVMRMPGTWNRKGAPVPTRLLNLTEARYNPDDFEAYICEKSVLKWTKAPQAWNLVKRADAEPPSAKFLLLCENEPTFRALCLRIPRAGQTDRSASGFDFQLARIAFAAGWTGQEICNLLIAQRREHGADLKLGHPKYYELTLDGARAGIQTELTDQEPLQRDVTLPNDQEGPRIDQNRDNRIDSPNLGASDSDHGLIKELADAILKTDHFAQDAGHLLYVYRDGVYLPQGEEWIARRVKQLLEIQRATKKWSSHRAREVMTYIQVDAARLWDRPPATILNLTNGLLDLTTHALTPHSPAHLASVQLPVTYDPSAQCPHWDTFIERVLPSDCQILPYELVASAMRGHTADQKAVLLVGGGENGKSTLLKAITAVIGGKNVSGVSLHRLEADKFAVPRLLGKLANICADLPSDHLTGTSMFKAITGGDSIEGERKFQDSFQFTPFARLLFSANHYPQSKDSSQAFFRRWLVIPFDAVIAPHEKRADLPEMLSSSRERSGVLNRALAVLPDMTTRGGFTQTETTQAAAMEFREMTDPLAAWLDRHTALSPDAMVTKKDLLIRFNAAGQTGGRPNMSAKAFYAAVKRLRPTVTEAQRRVNGDLQWVFLGLKL